MNAKTNKRARILHMAALAGAIWLAEQCVAAGQAVNCADSGGYTPLHYAAMHGRSEMVRWLLARGADKTATAARMTPAAWAERNHYDETAKLLTEV